MAYPRNRYVPGTYKRSCDVCGFDYLRTELMERWDGVLVCQYDWHPKPPQEDGFVIPTRIPPALDVNEDADVTYGLTFTYADNTYVLLNKGLEFGSGDFSLEVYVSTTYSSGNHDVFSNYGTGLPFRRLIFTATGTVQFYLYDSDGNYLLIESDTSGLNDGDLHHIVGVRSGQSGYIYIDGSLDKSGSTSGLGSTDTELNDSIGGSPLYVDGFEGITRYVSAYNRALSANDVTFKYANKYIETGLDADDNYYHVPGLVGKWIFQDGSLGLYRDGTEIYDSSGNNRTGKMYNFTSNPWTEL